MKFKFEIEVSSTALGQGKTQEELVGLMTQRNDKDKKLLLLRRMSDEALASGARRTLMGTSSKSMLDIGAEMINRKLVRARKR